MSTISVLYARIIVIFVCLDIVRAEYLTNYGKSPHRRQNGDFSDDYWPDTSFDENNSFNTIKNSIEESEDASRRGVSNERQNKDDSVSNETSDKQKLSQPELGVRARLASNLKSVLEEMLELVTEDIEKTKRLAYALESHDNARSFANNLLKDESSEQNDDNLLYEDDDPELNVADDWMEGIQDMRRINRNIKFEPITSLPKNYYHRASRQPIDYRVAENLKKRKPNEMLLTYDRGFPHFG